MDPARRHRLVSDERRTHPAVWGHLLGALGQVSLGLRMTDESPGDAELSVEFGDRLLEAALLGFVGLGAGDLGSARKP